MARYLNINDNIIEVASNSTESNVFLFPYTFLDANIHLFLASRARHLHSKSARFHPQFF